LSVSISTIRHIACSHQDRPPDCAQSLLCAQARSAWDSAASEQSRGIGQINIAVTQLDQMTQQNAAAARSLERQANRMAEVVVEFKL
jgi:methyl-accepting chemotaxis protein